MILEKKFKHLEYLLYLPEDYKEGQEYPLLIHLHGMGGVGKNLELLKKAEPIFEAEHGRRFPFIMAEPQCHAETWFVIFNELLEFIDFILSNDMADKKRIYLSGISMGGCTAWLTAITKPELFAALVPVCGGGMYWQAKKLTDLPVWAFHGALDDVIYVSESIHMVSAVNRHGGNAKLTIYPELSHNCWDRAFSTDELYDWLLLQQKN